MSNNIYILLCENELKIGVSNNVEKRRNTVQTSRSTPVTIYHFEERDDAYKIEKQLFRAFSKYRKSGEWFEDIHPDIVKSKLFELVL